MLDRELLRQQSERVRAALEARGGDPAPLEEWLRLDGERRAGVTKVEELKRRRNEASEGDRRAQGEGR